MNTEVKNTNSLQDAVGEKTLIPDCAELELHFTSIDPLVLEEIRFTHPYLERTTHTFRGRTPREENGGCFHWTIAVRGLVLLLIRNLITNMRGEPAFRLVGGGSSLAAAFDYAITKQPQWLRDVFGFSENNVSLSRYVFKRINSERKRGGEVIVMISEKYPKCVAKVFVAGNLVSSVEDLEKIAAKVDFKRGTSIVEPLRERDIQSERKIVNG